MKPIRLKKCLDELYKMKFTLEQEITTLKSKDDITTNDFDGGKYKGKIEGRIEAKEWMLVQVNQSIIEVLE